MSKPRCGKSPIVPKCGNTITNAPEKLFFMVPYEPIRRTKWLQVKKRTDLPEVKNYIHCYEDHFDNTKTYLFNNSEKTQPDMENNLEIYILTNLTNVIDNTIPASDTGSSAPIKRKSALANLPVINQNEPDLDTQQSNMSVSSQNDLETADGSAVAFLSTYSPCIRASKLRASTSVCLTRIYTPARAAAL
ncbi:hypothetical protein EVAR_3076_1 [Eumeta japonica]|uniref:THAP-type domain-containing protein n=1 Tax=Eumeta variegata TaxID=151549 RepID=A0A4C1STP8_EUMVA|nr:hypothetical protein EVAR_3076_1 [Eumeta japonica]